MSTIGRIRISARLKSVLGGLLFVFLTSCSDSFVYQVQVSDGAKVIPQAQVQISIRNSNLRPLTKLADTNGNAVFDIPADYRNQAGLLQVRANGYAAYNQNVDITSDLPTQIVLQKPSPPGRTEVAVKPPPGGDASPTATPHQDPPPIPPPGCKPDIKRIEMNRPVGGKIAQGQIIKFCFSAQANTPLILDVGGNGGAYYYITLFDGEGITNLGKLGQYYRNLRSQPGIPITVQKSGEYLLVLTGTLDFGDFSLQLSPLE